ncbi:MAG: RNA 2',3'-cyclic phosphodiesterase [Planctomycetes bacterium]|nr:RNA 2',3'-cyclic phosphodiesterase [Planctomycetota bacterium]
MRAFIAAEIPEEIRAGLLACQQELQASRPPVRWVPHLQLHVTLKFLGEIKPEQQEAIAQAVAQVAQAHAGFSAEVRGLGGFPNLHRPSILWAGLSTGREDFIALADSLEKAFRPLGFSPESRPFHPHITLGRVKSPRGIEALGKQIEENVAKEIGRFDVRDLVFFQSLLSSSGAEHRPLQRLALACKAGKPSAENR